MNDPARLWGYVTEIDKYGLAGDRKEVLLHPRIIEDLNISEGAEGVPVRPYPMRGWTTRQIRVYSSRPLL